MEDIEILAYGVPAQKSREEDLYNERDPHADKNAPSNRLDESESLP